MAFPTTPLLDAFTGANENPISTNWNGPIDTGDGTLQRLSNTLQASGGGDASGWYDVTTFGPDCEVYVTLTTETADTQWQALLLRLNNPGGSFSGYAAILFSETVTDVVDFYRYTAGGASATHIGSTITQEFISGDVFGASMVGNVLTAYRNSASIGSTTDSTNTTAGYLGVRVSQGGSSVVVFDNFGGGTVPDTVPPISIPTQAARW